MTKLADTPAGVDTGYSPWWRSRALKGGLHSASRIVPLLVELVRPTSVLDVGCGPATWLAEFREQGVTDVLGVDGDPLDPQILQIPGEQFMVHDLTRPLSLRRRFDLVLCLEVGEHLPLEAAPELVKTLTGAGPVVVFSAAIPFQGGTHHVNERWPEYWASLFRERGFEAVEGLRLRFWQDDAVVWYYRQNMVTFVERRSLPDYPALQADHDRFGGELLSLVHPDRYLRLAHRSPLRMREDLVRRASARFPRTVRSLSTIRLRLPGR